MICGTSVMITCFAWKRPGILIGSKWKAHPHPHPHFSVRRLGLACRSVVFRKVIISTSSELLSLSSRQVVVCNFFFRCLAIAVQSRLSAVMSLRSPQVCIPCRDRKRKCDKALPCCSLCRRELTLSLAAAVCLNGIQMRNYVYGGP
jgi:hypothetical protein